MNGVCEMRIAGKVYPLKFGIVAVEEFSRLCSDNVSKNANKAMIELIYSGLFNHAIANRLPAKSFSEVYDLVEEFNNEDDAADQIEKIWETFNQSKYGSEWLKKIEGLAKKKDELSEPTGTLSDPSPLVS